MSLILNWYCANSYY